MNRYRHIYFNELSQYPYSETSEEATQMLQSFFELLNALYEYDGLDVARFRIGEAEYLQWKIYPTQSIQDIINKPEYRKYQEFFYSHFDCPIVERLSEINSKIEQDSPKLLWADKEIPCKGLAAAYYAQSIAVSFDNDPFWRSIVFKLKINYKDVTVLALADKKDLENELFKEWIAKVRPTEIPQSTTNPNEKRCHLSGDHHGKGELKSLWKKLKYKVYVEECICSLEFNSRADDPILSVYDNGVIDVVDIASDAGYAMKIRTTARDRYKTLRVAEMIRKWLK